MCVGRTPLISELLYFVVDKEFHFLFSDSLYSSQIKRCLCNGKGQIYKKGVPLKKPKLKHL